MAVILQTPLLENYVLLYSAWTSGFSAWWCFCMCRFPPWLHKWLQGENRVTSSSGIIHRLDWLPWTHAGCIYAGCKSVPINHGRRCKLHWGCSSVLTNFLFVWYQHGDRRVRSVSQVSFPEFECLVLRDVPPKLGFSFRIPTERTPIGTFHFRNSWSAVGSFCADFHESHRRSS